MKTILEVCVDSYASAMAAVAGGANRLELCSCLLVGGLTPDVALLEQIREKTDIPIRCLMRPRFGEFLYDESEIQLMARLIAAAGGRGVTLPRAFDVCRDGLTAARQAVELGVDTILTSGQAADCWTGRAYLSRLLAENLPVTVMAGGGVSGEVIRRLLALPLYAFHMSGKTTVNSGMTFRREGVPMGLPGLDEFTIWQTDGAKVRAAATVLREAGRWS